jgi:microcystin-dependent protein
MEVYIGTIMAFGFGFTPNGWLPCNGQLLAISEYEALYMLIGTTYGGDGQTTFALPDLRGRTPISQGQGPGLSNVRTGQASGSGTVTMSAINMPAHIHPLIPGQVNAQTKIPVTATGGGTNEPGEGEFGFGAGGSFPAIFSDSSTYGNTEFLAGVQNNVNLNTGAVGSNMPINITNPYLAVNICISPYGIFPSQN